MVADVLPAAFQHAAFGALRTSRADRSEQAMLVAQMLAAAAWDVEVQGATLRFRDLDGELTVSDWLAIAEALDTLRRAHGALLSEDGDGYYRLASQARDILPPGSLEMLRRAILQAVPSPRPDEGRIPVPVDLLHAVLDFAGGQHSFEPPPAVRSLLADAADVRDGERVYCAYQGTAGVALELTACLLGTGATVRLELPGSSTAELCAWLAFAGGLNTDIRVCDPLEHARGEHDEAAARAAPPEAFDVAVVNGPVGFNRRERGSTPALGTHLPVQDTSEDANIALALAKGRRLALCLVPSGFLFRTTRLDQAFREQAIRRHGLDAVVGLPSGSLSSDAGVAGALLQFAPLRHSTPPSERSVLVVDGRPEKAVSTRGEVALRPGLAEVLREQRETQFSALVGEDDLAAQDYNLAVDRYVLSPEARQLRNLLVHLPSAPLDDVAELHKPQALGTAEEGERAEEFLEVGVADVGDAGAVERPGKRVRVDPKAAVRARDAMLESGDVLVVAKGSVGKVGYVRAAPQGAAHPRWLAGQSFVVVRLRRNGPLQDARVLFRYLASPHGQIAIQSLSTGTVIPNLKMPDLRRLPILVPPLKEQQDIASQVEEMFDLQDRIQAMRRELDGAQRAIWPGALAEVAS